MAKVKGATLMRGAIKCLVIFILCLVPDELPDRFTDVDPIFALALSDEEVEERAAVRGQPSPMVRQGPKTRVLRKLMEQSSFYDRTAEPMKGARARPTGMTYWEWRASCNIFLVPKKVTAEGRTLHRLIHDARRANHLIKKGGLPVSLITLEELKAVLGRLSSSGRRPGFSYAVCDLRHWFHAIALPQRYRPLFEIHTGKGFYYYPKALPMGWTAAPAIAQAATLAILLGSDRNRDEQGQPSRVPRLAPALNVDTELLEAMIGKDGATVPPFIPLRNGGAIIVFLDNILVASKDPRTVNAWQERILHQCGVHNATIKGMDEYKRVASEGRTDVLHPVRVGHVAEGEPLAFLGVRWRVRADGQMWVSVDLPAAAGPDPFQDGLQPQSGKWAGTRRMLYGILGRLLWHCSVISQPLCHPNAQGLVRLLSKFACHLAKGESWSDIVELSESETSLIATLWERRNKNDEVGLPRLARAERLTRGFGASDASGEKRLVGLVRYSMDDKGDLMEDIPQTRDYRRVGGGIKNEQNRSCGQVPENKEKHSGIGGRRQGEETLRV